jgi:hypothetical protein
MLVLVLLVVAFPRWAEAGGNGTEPDPAAVEEAKRLYAEAHSHFVAGRCGDAMPLLLRANALVPSPNSGLLIARCLVTENKPVAAAGRYGEVERDALNLVRAGETRYGDTAAAAAKEGAALRALLGTVKIRLKPRSGVALEIDGAPTEIGAAGETIVLHEPGSAKIGFVLPAGKRERVVSVTAGKESLVSYEAEDTAPPPVQGQRPSPGLPWTAYASGGVALAGVISFAGFGLASESTYSDLKNHCAPSCQPTDEAEADRGRRFQTIANVSLVVSAVFAVVTTVIVLTR